MGGEELLHPSLDRPAFLVEGRGVLYLAFHGEREPSPASESGA